MPAVSKAQRTVTAMAEHAPEKLYKKNRSLLSMRKKTLHEYATTPVKGLPKYKRKTKGLLTGK